MNNTELVKASPNFSFLKGYSDTVVQAALSAERNVFIDPVTSLMRLRQFSEMIAQEVAAYVGVYTHSSEKQSELLKRLRDRNVLTFELSALFHDLRIRGNEAAHQGLGTQRQALYQLRMARKIAVWFHRSFKESESFKVGPFVPPPDPHEEDQALKEELAQLRVELQEAQSSASLHAEEAQLATLALEEAQAAQKKAYDDLEALMQLAQETEDQAAKSQAEFIKRLEALNQKATESAPHEVEELVQKAHQAGDVTQLDLSEADTRKLIDQQLRDAGWEVDTAELSYPRGARPLKGHNRAIAEWPTQSGPADYVLFVGLEAIAVIEAKRQRVDVSSAIEQAKRYSRDFRVHDDERLCGSWEGYHIPFMFSTNGRPYLKQLETKSGIWFLDGRLPTNLSRPLMGWYSPSGLQALLKRDVMTSESMLNAESFEYLGLRSYQIEAIQAVEAAVSRDQRAILLAMATGTGKTRTALGLIYRFLKSQRFRRILFLVDRTSLGVQALGAFENVRLESVQTLKEIYDIKGLDEITPEEETRLHVATVQGMVKRLLYPHDHDSPIPVDQYDCIIVDESHRGYHLDKEMSETELSFRSQEEYISKYRRVLDYFDAFSIALTATPALHTTEIFNAPVYQYSYRQAVIDGYLVDHQPPLLIKTKLSTDGITFEADSEVLVLDRQSKEISTEHLPDEVTLEVEHFHTRVISENFNRVICAKLAEEIDPNFEEKTLVFCVNNDHADMVVKLLKEAFKERYGAVNENAVVKITGSADRPLELIKRYQNEEMPRVAVTVDLLTTGIDVPKICNLVFLRRVKSRILFEQMLGRATRLCPSIGKESFRVFDAVDIYKDLQQVSAMKPVVAQPRFTFSELIEELSQATDKEHQEALITEIKVKFNHRKQHIIGEQATSFEVITKQGVEAFLETLDGETSAAIAMLTSSPLLSHFLDQLKSKKGSKALISRHDDHLIETTTVYLNKEQTVEDYLESFKAFIESKSNDLPALLAVTQRPRELTRAQLRELALELDQEGFSETRLRTAFFEATNQDVAAGIMGFIRRQALGSPLVSYEERVNQALSTLLASRAWSKPQRQWLDRIGLQLKQEVIVDKTALDQGMFKVKGGGFNRLNRVFDGQLEEILADLHDGLWRDQA